MTTPIHRLIILNAICLSAIGCATRAPTKFELDRRAGLVPEAENVTNVKEAHNLRAQPSTNKVPGSPHRIGPRIEKIWVYDQELTPSAWMQGTYVFLEVEPGQWLNPDNVGEVQ